MQLDAIINEIANRSNLTVDQINSLIQKKKTEIGSGYLTDMGAAYLIASDLGLTLPEIKVKTYKLNELVEGLNSINVSCYFLSMSEPRTFIKKDGTVSEYCIMQTFDDGIILRVLLWDIDKVKEKHFDIGKAILLENVNTKIGRDNKIEIHTTKLTQIIEQNVPTKELTTIAKEINKIKSQENELVVVGVLRSQLTKITFIGKDNLEKNAVSFLLYDRNDPTTNIRTILWLPTEIQVNSLIENKEIMLVNVKSRLGIRGNYEIHGDKNTKVIILGERQENIKLNRFTILSLGILNTKEVKRTMLLTDGINVFVLNVFGEGIDLMKDSNVGDVIELKNYYIKDNQILLNNFIDNLEIVGSDDSILSNFFITIKDISQKKTPVIVEAVALSKSTTKTIKLKSGKDILKTELLIGDETGETQLFGWEEKGKQLIGILPGTRLMLYGVFPARMFDGSFALQCKEYTQLKIIYS